MLTDSGSLGGLVNTHIFILFLFFLPHNVTHEGQSVSAWAFVLHGAYTLLRFYFFYRFSAWLIIPAYENIVRYPRAALSMVKIVTDHILSFFLPNFSIIDLRIA